MTKSKQVNNKANENLLCLSSIRNSISSQKGRKQNFIIKNFVFLFALMVIQSGSLLFAQDIDVRGKITTAEDGSVLIGANILEKGTANGTVTDAKGEFRLKVKTGAVLVISYVGYVKEEIKIVDRNYLNVILKVDVKQVDEVVVVGIGYGEIKKSDATGSVTAISAKDFSKGSISSPQEMLIGKAPGVVANTLGGAAGAGTKIRIRGGSTINGNNDPLIVIDNIPVESAGISGMANPLSTLNPNDIESFTILKDASATAIYGSRASNGVIIIKTKKGILVKEGFAPRLLVNYGGSISISTPGKKMEVLSGDEFRTLIKDRVKNFGLTADAEKILGTANTNWQDEIYRNAVSTEHNLSFNYALANVPFRFSTGYLIQQGILKHNKMDRKSLGLTINPSLFDGQLTMELNANASYIYNNFSNNDAIGSAVEFDPTQTVKSNDPKLAKYGGYFGWLDKDGNPNNIATHNPVARLEYRDNYSNASRYILGGKFDYKIPYIDGLKATLNLGYDNYRTDGIDNMDLRATWAHREPANQTKSYYQKKTNELLDFYLNYKNELDFGKFDVTGGYSYQHFYNEGSNTTQAWDKSGLKSIPYKNEYYLISFFGRMNYTLMDKYLFTITLRNDGSSRFGKDNRWGLFPAAAVAWKLTEESFIGKSEIINDLKLRFSWGKTGQQDIGDNYYPYIPTYTGSTQGAYYQMGNEFIPTLRPDVYDPNIKWETVTSLNLGLDYSLFKNRVSGSIEVYKNTTDDLLNRIPIAIGSNFSNFLLTNVGSMENKGIEFSLNVTPILEQDITWEIGMNLTYNKNEITKLTLFDDPAYTGVNTGGISGGVGNNIQKFIVGKSARIFYLFQQVYDKNGKPIEGLYVDRSGKGGNVTGNELNKDFFKSPDPEYLIGISSKVNYKNFDFSFSGRISLGNYVYNNNASNRALYQQAYNQSGYLSNILSAVKESNFTNAQYWSNYYLENGSYFKLDYISLGYNFTDLMGVKLNGRIGLSVQNVFTITKYSGIDPEVDNGIDNNIYPRPRTYMLSFNLNY